MSVEVVWDSSEETSLRLIFEGRWLWSELSIAIEDVRAMLDSVDHKVNLIVDLQRSIRIPGNATYYLKHFSTALPHPLPSRTVVFVGMNQLTRALLDAFCLYHGEAARRQRYLVARTLDEARKMLAQQPART